MQSHDKNSFSDLEILDAAVVNTVADDYESIEFII